MEHQRRPLEAKGMAAGHDSGPGRYPVSTLTSGRSGIGSESLPVVTILLERKFEKDLGKSWLIATIVCTVVAGWRWLPAKTAVRAQ